jgi:hypothetical protein
VDGRTRTLFAVLFVAVVAITGVVAIVLSETSTPNPDAPPGTTAVVGIVVAVDSQGLGDVRGFTLRAAGGELLEFDLGAYESDAEFPAGHLAEHQVTAMPVRVWYRDGGGARLAIRLEDAPS